MEGFALVTGSADRLGKGIALDLAAIGFDLLLHYNHSEKKIEILKEEIEQMNRKAIPLQIDFLETNDYDKLFRDLKEKGIVINVLVNCASDFQPSTFQEAGASLLQKQIKINFENAYLLTKAFARVFEKGVIINVLDTKISKNFSKHLDYLLSKKLLNEFTKLSAIHLAPNIRVNAIAPGLILPPADKDEAYLHELAEKIPLKRTGSMLEILKAVRFLLDSQFVTGQVLYIDGGDHLL